MREGPWSITLLSEKDGPTVRKITSFPLAFLQNVFLRLVMERKNRQILGIMKKPGQKTEGPILLSRLNNQGGALLREALMLPEDNFSMEKNL
jgi:hypothetical protein